MKKFAIYAAVIVFLIIGVLVLNYILSDDNGADRDSEPDFTLESSSGEKVSLYDYFGKTVVINFWASWCPPCREEMPDMDRLNNYFENGTKCVFISINLTDKVSETRETADEYIASNGFGFDILYDEDGLLASRYNLNSIPRTLILDRKLKLVETIPGMTTYDKIIEIIDKIK